jgi:hypothetical protein
MPDHRKPPMTPASRKEPARPTDDSLDFSIETTTMRLKSLRLRRAEAADREIDAVLRANEPPPPALQRPLATGPVGRVRHDERGMAVWDWAVATGEHAALSATNVMRKLEVADLSIEETQRSRSLPTAKAPAVPCGDPYNTGGGKGSSDPYNSRDVAKRVADSTRRPPPATSGRHPGAVLDQLTGKKK